MVEAKQLSAAASARQHSSRSSGRAGGRNKGRVRTWQAARWCNLFWLIAGCVIFSNLRLDFLGLPSNTLSGRAPYDYVDEAIPRTLMTSLMESPSWEWGACAAAAPMYGASVCSRTYCVNSVAHPGVYIDLFYHAFQRVTDPSVIDICEEPAGGQVGFRTARRDTQVSFIITYKDQPRRTVQCMLELFRTAREAVSVEFVLVNDGSNNDTSAVDAAGHMLRDHFGVPVTRVHNTRSVGYGAANNMGVKAASGKYIVLMVSRPA